LMLDEPPLIVRTFALFDFMDVAILGTGVCSARNPNARWRWPE
jgi:hypothetical protein